MSPGPTVNYMRPQLARGQRQYINPFKPKEYPSENWPWGVGEAMKQGKMRHYFSKTEKCCLEFIPIDQS